MCIRDRSGDMVCHGQRQCTGFDESGAKVYAAGRCDRRRHHLVCDPEYEYAGAGQGGASDRDRATDRGISCLLYTSRCV